MPTATYTVKKQEFLNSVINKVGKQIYSNSAFVNPLKRLKRGFIENANEIEEIYVARAVGYDYDPTGAGSLDRVKPVITTQYHQVDYAKDFTVSVHDKQVRKGFNTTGGVNKLANEIIASQQVGAEYEEYIKTIELLTTIATTSKFKKQVGDVLDNATAKTFTKELKKTINRMARRTTDYATLENNCKAENLILFLNEDWEVEIDVELLASAFNMSKQQITEMTIIKIPSLGTTTVKAILMDERALQIYDTYYANESVRNTKGKFTNHHLSTEKIFSWSNMVNIAVFQTAAVTA